MREVPDKALTYGFHDVNQAYPAMQDVLKTFGIEEQTRNGPAKTMPVPVTVSHFAPWRRVLFDPKRDANPFFHYMESIWMMTGRDHVTFPALFARNIKNYSDDGWTLHGAYGHRWFYAFERDQVDAVIHMLKKDPKSRRCVIAMWDPILDLEKDTKDLPCNTHLYFRVLHNRLDMTICNRSNDLVWGMLGANIVHFSYLMEYISEEAGIPLGTMHQFTNNLHVYEGWDGEDKIFHPDPWYQDHPNVRRWTFCSRNFDVTEAERFVDDLDLDYQYKSRVMRDNVLPMYGAWLEYKKDDLPLAIHLTDRIYDEDWQEACKRWLMRRVK